MKRTVLGGVAAIAAVLATAIIWPFHSPVTSGASLAFEATFSTASDFYGGFDYGYSGLVAPQNGIPTSSLTFHGDHDMNCGAPTTSRPVSILGTPSALDFSQLFWHCAPGGDPAKGHMMTAVDTLGYNLAWFSPKPLFTGITKVCWDVNETTMSGRKWQQLLFVSQADATRYPAGTVTFDTFARGSGGFDLGYTSPFFRQGAPNTGIFPQGGTLAGLKWSFEIYDWFQNQDTWTAQSVGWPGTLPGGGIGPITDKAARYKHCVENQPDNTIRVTADSPAGQLVRTFPGQIPQHPVRVVFQDDNYDPVKDSPAQGVPNGTYDPNVLTWHWDNIQVFTGDGAPATTAPPTTAPPTTAAPTTAPTTVAPTTVAPTTAAPTTAAPTTAATTPTPTTAAPTTAAPTTAATTPAPTTVVPTSTPTTGAATTAPTTAAPTTVAPTTAAPTTAPTTVAPTTAAAPTTVATTPAPTTAAAPTTVATTPAPTAAAPTTAAPTTVAPTTAAPTTVAPTTAAPTTVATTPAPTAAAPPTTAAAGGGAAVLPPPSVPAAAPNITITGGPAQTTTERDAVITFDVADFAPTQEFSGAESVTFTCSLDGGDGRVCTSPARYVALNLGEHEVVVKAADSVTGAVGSARYRWTIVEGTNRSLTNRANPQSAVDVGRIQASGQPVNRGKGAQVRGANVQSIPTPYAVPQAVPPTEQNADTLSTTGARSIELAMIGLAMIAIGLVMAGAASRLRRRSA